MKTLSLRWRLAVLVALVLIAGFAVIAFVAYHEMEESVQRSARQMLGALAATAFSAGDESDDDAKIQAEFQSIVRATTHKESTRYCFWWDEQAPKVGPVDSPETHELFRHVTGAVSPPPEGHDVYLRVGQGKEAFGVIWARKAIRNRLFNVAVAYSNRYAYNEMREFRNVILVLAGGVALATGAATYLVILAGLRPIGRTAQILRGITGRDMKQADVDALPMPPELKPFLRSLSDMLGRLDLAMQTQRRFTADASHELRTPLAVAKSTLQAVRNRSRSPEEYEQAVDEVLLDLQRMERLVGQLLTLAGLDNAAGVHSFRPVRLDVLAAEAAAAEGASLDAADRLACGPLANVSVKGVDDLLRMMIGNLVRNALVHGPARGKVTISLQADASQTIL